MPHNVVDKKKVIIDLFRQLGIIKDNETGQIILHLNCGGVTKIVKTIEVK